MVHEVISYINTTEATDEAILRNSTKTLYRIVDILLQQENSISNIAVSYSLVNINFDPFQNIVRAHIDFQFFVEITKLTIVLNTP